MCRLIDDISGFLESHGFACSRQMRHDFDVLCVRAADGRSRKVILPLEVSASGQAEAARYAKAAEECIDLISLYEGYPLILTEDRWKSQGTMMKARLLAHLELFSSVFARNCEVRRLEKSEAQAFLSENHAYGYAACRYRYGLFLKGRTGGPVAVAAFSNARRWLKDGKEIRSYEWTRYASLPDMRVSGGMGKLLKAFIEEVRPDDVMSYADLEWSEGSVYERLGFVKDDIKEAVMFAVDPRTWRRCPISRFEGKDTAAEGAVRYFRNFGSNKYRLKLTEYE